MDKLLIGTNWKMTKSLAEGSAYIEKLIPLAEKYEEHFQLFIIPSHTALPSAKEAIKGSSVWLGAQNMHYEDFGAFTGEISPVHLKELNIDLIELGHSERRQYFNETDTSVNSKLKAALNHDLKALVCIGEPLDVFKEKTSFSYIQNQLDIIFEGISFSNLENIIVAYEPIWAIGEGGTEAAADYVGQIHAFIREALNERYNSITNIPLLFGGSVNKNNAVGYLKHQHVNGLFIGRSAWEVHLFEELLMKILE